MTLLLVHFTFWDMLSVSAFSRTLYLKELYERGHVMVDAGVGQELKELRAGGLGD